jgi:succinoglycan biosynthesis protein ExoW
MPGNTPRRVAVVIPFYQRERGILPRAVTSALGQLHVRDVEIIVVDDGSPVPAQDELGPLLVHDQDRLRILRRTNGGPGAARNTGLEAVNPDTTYVAFLDSDDAWIPSHLHRALVALDLGYDFYFSDFFQLDQTVSAFRRAGRIEPSRHRAVPGVTAMHEWSGDMLAQILTGNVIGTSTVVYRRSCCPDLRFQEEYSHAGEDYLFWLDVSARTKRLVFSSDTECTYGKGINVYSGSGWGTAGSLRRTHCEMKYLKAVSRRYPLSPALSTHVGRNRRRLRRYFVRDVLHRLSRGEALDPHVLREQLRHDVWSGMLFAPLACLIAFAAIKAKLTATHTVGAMAALVAFLKDSTWTI